MWKRFAAVFFCMLLLCSNISAHAEEDIVRSNVDYNVTLRDASLVFIGNNKAVDWKVGDKYFLTYTVEDVTKSENFQSGMIATKGAANVEDITTNSIADDMYIGLRFKVTDTSYKLGNNQFLQFKMSGVDFCNKDESTVNLNVWNFQY